MRGRCRKHGASGEGDKIEGYKTEGDEIARIICVSGDLVLGDLLSAFRASCQIGVSC